MTAATPSLIGKVVVIVEDEHLVRDLTVCELEEEGFSVVEFETADDALPYLRQNGAKLAVVITDVQMPGLMNGLQLVEVLNGLWPELRVLITSGGALVNPSKLPPSAKFVAKPWLPSDLASRVKAMALEAAA